MKLTIFEGIDTALLPLEKIYHVGESEYKFLVDYNTRGEFFTLKISDSHTDELLYTTALLYSSPSITLYIDENFRDRNLVPVDPDDITKNRYLHEKLTMDNFTSAVKLAFIEEEL